ncbi:MAG: RluA family pseudouridine synthase [Verrucomicrobiota bacterium]|nr:RluA family pseudouridine synthase [Verrucomicrobiota bacterium]
MQTTAREFIPLPARQRALILYEDKNVLVIDKPAGWILAPRHWKHTSRNLQRALEITIQEHHVWVKRRNLRFLRYVHRLDAETSGLVILARNRLALKRFTQLFEIGSVKKLYVAIVPGLPPKTWRSSMPISICMAPQPQVKVGRAEGKPASTSFTRIATYILPNSAACSVVLVEPQTGRMHQIRAHLSATGFPVLADPLYWDVRLDRDKFPAGSDDYPLGLRAAALGYPDPVKKTPCTIIAEVSHFLAAFRAPKPVIQTVENAVKNWETRPGQPPNNGTEQSNRQDVHNG